MITGAGISSVYFNLKLRHPTLDIPLIDYNLVLLMLPVILLGISIGVSLSVVFSNWMITVLLIIIFIGNMNVQIGVHVLLFSYFLGIYIHA